MATKDNLKEAFAGESQANRMYLAFAKRADADGFPGIAKLFRAAADAETIHAHAHFRVLGGVKGTGENLESAIRGETFEFKEMYPSFLKEAEADGDQGAVASFKNALAVEKIHHDLYTQAFNAFKGGKDLPKDTISVCPVCGNTIMGNAPDKCPVCGVPGERFFEVK